MSATSYLIRPTPVFRESYLEALREGYRRGAQQTMGDARIIAIAADFEAHLAGLDQDGQSPRVENGRTVPTVPSNAFWLVDGADFIGSVHIRARTSTPSLARYGGHVGYGIRPSMRRKGYGTRILALTLQICRGMGIDIVRLSCAEDNIASRRIIEANGGVFLRRGEPEWFVDHPYLLFEIVLI
jgi:predicted acetyltransferase